MTFKQILNERQYDLAKYVKDGKLNLSDAMLEISNVNAKSVGDFVEALNRKIEKGSEKIILSRGETSFEITKKDAKSLSNRIDKAFEDGVFSLPAWKKFENSIIKEKENREEGIASTNLSRDESGFTIDGKIDNMLDGAAQGISFADYLMGSSSKDDVNFFKADVKLTRKGTDLSNAKEVKNKIQSETLPSGTEFNYIEVKRGKPNSKAILGQIMSIRNKGSWDQFVSKAKKRIEEKLGKKISPDIAKRYAVRIMNKIYKGFQDDNNGQAAVLNRIYTHFSPKGKTAYLAIGDEKGRRIVPFTRKYVDLEFDFIDKGFAPTSGEPFIPRINVLVSIKPGVKDKYEESFNNFKEELLSV